MIRQIKKLRMGSVINLSDYRLPHVNRNFAIDWLLRNIERWPEASELEKYRGVGVALVGDWRFIVGLDGVVYFANCIDRGITKSEYRNMRELPDRSTRGDEADCLVRLNSHLPGPDSCKGAPRG